MLPTCLANPSLLEEGGRGALQREGFSAALAKLLLGVRGSGQQPLSAPTQPGPAVSSVGPAHAHTQTQRGEGEKSEPLSGIHSTFLALCAVRKGKHPSYSVPTLCTYVEGGEK